MDISNKIKKVNNDILKNIKKQRGDSADVENLQFVDYYDKNRRAREEMGKKSFPHGSAPAIIPVLMSVIGNVSPKHKSAKDSASSLRANGDTTRAKMVEEQYMEEVYLPAVETLIDMFGVDNLLNNKKFLDTMDGLTIIDGNGAGYTAAFIKEMHGDERGIVGNFSDCEVIHEVDRIRNLVADNQIGAAVGIANRIKDRIDKGYNASSEEDYELIQKVALR